MADNPYERHVRATFSHVTRFPHKMASEYPEEWLSRFLTALRIWLQDGRNGGKHRMEWTYTYQYALTYVEIAQRALRETLAERVRWHQETAVLPSEELHAEISQLKDEVEKLKKENALLSALVQARSYGTLQRVVQTVGELSTPVPPPAFSDGHAAMAARHQAARPSTPLIARTTSLQGQQIQKRMARQEKEKRLTDHLADLDVLPTEKGS